MRRTFNCTPCSKNNNFMFSQNKPVSYGKYKKFLLKQTLNLEILSITLGLFA